MRSRRREIQTKHDAAISKAISRAKSRSPKQAAMHLGLHGFDVGEWIGETNRASGDGGGDVKKWDTEGSAAAFVAAGFAGESRNELLAGGVVLHVGGIRTQNRRALCRRGQ